MFHRSLNHHRNGFIYGRTLARGVYGFALSAIFALAVAMAAGCAKPVTMADIPTYPGATELKESGDPIGTSLSQNMRTDAAVRDAAGIGGKMGQKGCRLPTNTIWSDVRGFYDGKLKASGWSSSDNNGMGGSAADMANNVLNVANSINTVAQTAVWTMGKQTLTVTMMANPVNSTERTVILSLSGM